MPGTEASYEANCDVKKFRTLLFGHILRFRKTVLLMKKMMPEACLKTPEVSEKGSSTILFNLFFAFTNGRHFKLSCNKFWEAAWHRGSVHASLS